MESVDRISRKLYLLKISEIKEFSSILASRLSTAEQGSFEFQVLATFLIGRRVFVGEGSQFMYKFILCPLFYKGGFFFIGKDFL